MTGAASATRRWDRRIVLLALPALGALAADPLLSLADTAMVARLGPEALAALGVNGAIFGFAFVVFNFLAYVTTPLVARALGSGDRAGAVELISRALVLGALLGLGATLVLFGLAPVLLDWMQTGGDVRTPALEYLRVRAWATPAVLVILAAHGGFRGLGDTRTPLFIALVINVVNLGLDAFFIFGLGLGVAGSALGSALAQYLGAGWFVLRLHRQVGPLSLPGVNWTVFATLLRPGGWVTMRTLLLVATLAAATAAAADLGTTELAAHQVLRETWFLSAMLVDGLAIAAQSLVGEAAGRRDLSGEFDLIRRLLLWGTVVGVVFSGLWLVGGEVLGVAFAPNQQVAGEIAQSIPMIAAFALPAAWLWVLDGVVLGQLRLRRMALSTTIGALLAGIVLATVPGNGWGLSGVWLAIGVMILGRLGVLVWGGIKRPAPSLR